MLLGYFGRPPQGLDSKSSDTDMVSDADREAERAIVDLLRAERPDDGVLGEEGAASAGASGRRWVVDPLDGTINFLYGFPAWAVSVALEDEQGTAVGVIYDPLREELFQAVRGGGARLNGQQLTMPGREALERAMVATGFSYEKERRELQAAVVARLLPQVRDIRRAGAAALDLAWLAAGRVDAFYENGLQPWDWAAGALLVTEAGGAVEELPGEPPCLLAASPGLLPQLRGLLSAPG